VPAGRQHGAPTVLRHQQGVRRHVLPARRNLPPRCRRRPVDLLRGGAGPVRHGHRPVLLPTRRIVRRQRSQPRPVLLRGGHRGVRRPVLRGGRVLLQQQNLLRRWFGLHYRTRLSPVLLRGRQDPVRRAVLRPRSGRRVLPNTRAQFVLLLLPGEPPLLQHRRTAVLHLSRDAAIDGRKHGKVGGGLDPAGARPRLC
jgi:hypothetical protein